MGGLSHRCRTFVNSSKIRRTRRILRSRREKSWEALYKKYDKADFSSSVSIANAKEFSTIFEAEDHSSTSTDEDHEQQFETHDNTLKNNRELYTNTVMSDEKINFSENPVVSEKCVENAVTKVHQNECLRDRRDRIDETFQKVTSNECVTNTVNLEEGYRIQETCQKGTSIECVPSTVNFNVPLDSSGTRQGSVRKTSPVNISDSNSAPNQHTNVTQDQNYKGYNSDEECTLEGYKSSCSINQFNVCNGSSPSDLKVDRSVDMSCNKKDQLCFKRTGLKQTRVSSDTSRRWKAFLENPGTVWYPFRSKSSKMSHKIRDFESILNDD